MFSPIDSDATAVGQALRRNPFAPEVPCHRVISADLKIGGFCGSKDVHSDLLQRKRRLLAEEGVLFESDFSLSDSARIYRF
jgi:methylated-DNA-[protein]-cysteine S-methyltransferase